jgi:cysteine desulfurase/selenocysteine lyase
MVYLDNAATTFPKPEEVSRAVYRFMTKTAANPGRSGHRLSMESAREVYDCREAASQLFGAPGPECVSFTLNATHAINFALKGSVKSGHVVTSCLEHNSVTRPLFSLTPSGVTYDTANVDLSDDDVTVANFERLLRPETVMIACTHASNLCGRVLPVKKLGELCQSRGIAFLVDASQTAGLLPIDMKEMNIDYLCMPGHKSLYGPMGTGMLIAAHGEQLDTLIEGGTGSNSSQPQQPDVMPDRLESGTVNAPGIVGLHAGIDFVRHHGSQNLYQKEMRLAELLYDRLSELNGIKLYTPRPDAGYVPVVCFNIGNLSSVETVSRLDKAGIALRGGLHCTPAAHSFFGTLSQGMIRASMGAFNTTDDILFLINTVKKISNT